MSGSAFFVEYLNPRFIHVPVVTRTKNRQHRLYQRLQHPRGRFDHPVRHRGGGKRNAKAPLQYLRLAMQRQTIHELAGAYVGQ